MVDPEAIEQSVVGETKESVQSSRAAAEAVPLEEIKITIPAPDSYQPLEPFRIVKLQIIHTHGKRVQDKEKQ